MSIGQIHIMANYVSLMPLTSLPVLWASDTIYAALITSSTTPSINDSDARWGAAGSQNYSTNEVTPGGNYAAGGVALSGNTVTTSFPNTNLNSTSPITWNANAANPTNARWVIFYSSTDAGKRVIGYGDLGSITSLVTGLQLKLNSSLSGTQPIFQAVAT